MERSIQKNGLINLLVLLAVGVAGFCRGAVTNSLAGQLNTIFLGIGALVAAVTKRFSSVQKPFCSSLNLSNRSAQTC